MDKRFSVRRMKTTKIAEARKDTAEEEICEMTATLKGTMAPLP